MTKLAPIVLFCYNRPDHVYKTLNALSENLLADQSELFVFCDGPKPDADLAQQQKIAEVRQIVKSRNWCGKITVLESPINKGLATSVIDGVTRIVNEFGRVIVLEDDIITSKYFLEYMNTALEKYKNYEKVMQISGFSFPINTGSSKHSCFFLPHITSWGWGTWKRAWMHFDPSATGYELLKKDNVLNRKFNFNDTRKFSDMLFSQMESKEIDSWAICWKWSVFKLNGLTLFPDKALTEHFGEGNDATHVAKNIIVNPPLELNNRISYFPEEIFSNKEKTKQLELYFKNIFSYKSGAPQNLFKKFVNNLLKRNN